MESQEKPLLEFLQFLLRLIWRRAKISIDFRPFIRYSNDSISDIVAVSAANTEGVWNRAK
jgi:hypothetical protein